MKLLPLALIGGGLYFVAQPKKKKKSKKSGGAKSADQSMDILYQPGATVSAIKDLGNYVVGPVGIIKEGSGHSVKPEVVPYPTVAKKISFKFPKGAKGNANMAGKVVGAEFFAQGPNFAKLIVPDGEFEIDGVKNVGCLVTNIKGSAAKLVIEEMMALVATQNYDLSEPGPTLSDAVDKVLAAVAPNVTFPTSYDEGSKVDKIRNGVALLGQLAYQSWWNQQA